MTVTRMSELAHADANEGGAAPPDRPPDAARTEQLLLAQILHGLWTEGRADALRRTAAAGLGAALLVLAGCGPIEPSRPKPRTPYIDPETVTPAQRVVPVTSNDTITLQATPYDPNRQDDPLYSAWVTQSQALLDEERPQTGTVELNGEKFYEYAQAELQINDPCGSIFADRDSETVWLYVADRPFRRVGGADNEVSVRPGGFLVHQSWVLSLESGTCTGGL